AGREAREEVALFGLLRGASVDAHRVLQRRVRVTGRQRTESRIPQNGGRNVRPRERSVRVYPETVRGRGRRASAALEGLRQSEGQDRRHRLEALASPPPQEFLQQHAVVG